MRHQRRDDQGMQGSSKHRRPQRQNNATGSAHMPVRLKGQPWLSFRHAGTSRYSDLMPQKARRTRQEQDIPVEL